LGLKSFSIFLKKIVPFPLILKQVQNHCFSIVIFRVFYLKIFISCLY